VTVFVLDWHAKYVFLSVSIIFGVFKLATTF